MSTNEAPKTLNDLIAQIRAINNHARSEGRRLLGQAFKDFFEACPEVRAIVWAQYAPFWNDGEPCEFSVHEYEVVSFSDKEEEDSYLSYGYGENSMISSWRKDRDNEVQARVRALCEKYLGPVFSSEAETILQFVFGDDCQVVATREGFETNEIEHE